MASYEHADPRQGDCHTPDATLGASGGRPAHPSRGPGRLLVVRAARPSGRARRHRRHPTGRHREIPVLVAAAQTRDVPIYLDGLGTVQASQTVTVKPQVDGQLIDVLFHEGQDVKQGDVLARIDPRTYQASLDQAVAKKQQDQANLANARLDLARYQKLATSQLHFGADLRHAARRRGAGRGAGGAGSGADRHRAHQSQLHDHHCADRRPHRAAPGRSGQHRPHHRRQRHRRADHAASDRGDLHAAAAAAGAGGGRHDRRARGGARAAAGHLDAPERGADRHRRPGRPRQPGGTPRPAPSS